MDDDTLPCRGFEHHEMIQVPVQDARHLQAPQRSQINAQRARAHAQAPGHRRKVVHGQAAQGNGVLEPEPIQICPAAMPAKDHRETGKPAFRRLCLADHRQAAAIAEAGQSWGVHQMRLRTPCNGSNIQYSRDRRSNTISAVSIMPGRSGISPPAVGTTSSARATSTR